MTPDTRSGGLPSVSHVVYLHGFASSPQSSKARQFAEACAARGCGFSCPDFNEPSFETLTVTRMLEQTEAAVNAAHGPVALVGSSLGAFVAVHAAARATANTSIDRLLLLAPAFDFGGNRLRQLGETGVDEWRRRGVLRVFHYGLGEMRDVGFNLYRDAATYDAYALSLLQPTLIVHGRRDELVSPESVELWTRERPNTLLRWVDDGHQLTASMNLILSEASALFGWR